MHISTLLTTVFATTTLAANCYTPWNWCGWDLIEEGNYIPMIRNRLRANNIPVNKHTINHSLWKCLSSSTGAVQFLCVCEECAYGGTSQSHDFCRRNRGRLVDGEGEQGVCKRDGTQVGNGKKKNGVGGGSVAKRDGTQVGNGRTKTGGGGGGTAKRGGTHIGNGRQKTGSDGGAIKRGGVDVGNGKKRPNGGSVGGGGRQ